MKAHSLTLPNFSFEAGGQLDSIQVVYHTSKDDYIPGDKVVWICHALTANSEADVWWPQLVGPGLLIDTDKYFVVCVNTLCSPYGSSGPASINPDTGNPYLFSFPATTIRDMMVATDAVRKHLGISQIDLLIGSSIGGFQAIEWSIMQPKLFRNLLFMATSARVSPWHSAENATQRMALEADPSFRSYANSLTSKADDNSTSDSASDSTNKASSDSTSKAANNSPAITGGAEGLKCARAQALVTYRCHKAFCLTQAEEDEDTLFACKAASYERYQGEKLVKRNFDAYSYKYLLDSLDSHNSGRGRGGVQAALGTICAQKTTVVAIDTDGIFPPEEMQQWAAMIPGAKFKVIHSNFGHDGFLLETAQLTPIIEDLL